MPAESTSFRESTQFAAPIRKLGLTIEGTRLAPIIEKFERELVAKGITRLKPKFHLSTEWGVPFGSIAIGIPFYLARPDLTELHGELVGHIEGFNPRDILRYLRHEMGHVVNYAYKLYEDEEWVKFFGSITQPYVEEYRPSPFSRRFVRHLPGWYAQKHPDEDWAETFAVWMTPDRDFRKEYSHWPAALAKVEYCDRTMDRLKTTDPLVTVAELDEDVGELDYSVEQYYKQATLVEGEFPAGLDGALRAIFDELAEQRGGPESSRPASELIKRLERSIMAEVFTWTGHFPEKTRSLLRQLASHCDALELVYPVDRESQAGVALTVFVTSLAMNHVHRGSYFPELGASGATTIEEDSAGKKGADGSATAKPDSVKTTNP